jgi:hypothetical protein
MTSASILPHLPLTAVLTPWTHLDICGVQSGSRSHQGEATRTRHIKGDDIRKLQRQHTSTYGSHFPPHQLQHTSVRPMRLHLHPQICPQHLHLQWHPAASAKSNGIFISGYWCGRDKSRAIPIYIMPAIVPATAVAMVIDNDRDPSSLCQSVNHPRDQQ